MSRVDLTRLDELYFAALERAPDERDAYLATACDDDRLRRRVKRMIGDARDAEAFMEAPVSMARSRHPTSRRSGRTPIASASMIS